MVMRGGNRFRVLNLFESLAVEPVCALVDLDQSAGRSLAFQSDPVGAGSERSQFNARDALRPRRRNLRIRRSGLTQCALAFVPALLPRVCGQLHPADYGFAERLIDAVAGGVVAGRGGKALLHFRLETDLLLQVSR